MIRRSGAYDRRALVGAPWGGPGHYLQNWRQCHGCGNRKPIAGGTTNRGSHFRCAECKAKGSIPK